MLFFNLNLTAGTKSDYLLPPVKTSLEQAFLARLFDKNK
jgi:hypothetical protein